ncbi:Putative type IIS restriction /modification enzyme, N-terminal half [hydrothermal vent metagenome]|uniref:site-specific DNA-methyltransferase (adenine-specific) n=1 Tax=hydrothermal vent metagenome TaxID=652676 RepID=A0A3B0VHV5_9ZZZZ
MPAPAQLLQLIDRFERNRDAYRSGKYNETQVRREFIDPLLTLLGWDVDNKAGYAEQYKQVVHEDAIKVGGSSKAPDYSLRIGGQRKLFVEAKKPSINIKTDISPAFQVRRYAWSAKLPLSILTDFEEFAVYDCRNKPDKNDKASHARIIYFTYEQYAEKWDELVALFSPEAIMQGAFDKYVKSSKKKRGTAEVDDAFLAEISDWRDGLARNIALQNSGITTRQLNHAVQRTIDRLIFLRIAEDRGIEQYGRLRDRAANKEVYANLGQLFRQADAKYNSGLFHFKSERGRDDESLDTFTLQLTIDDKVLKQIIKRLYYPDSPYQFDVIPADILGQVYEQFLGKVIRLTAGGQAKIEEKPEVKKAGGVFYTPTYIVEYIVQQTVGKLVEGKKPGKAGGVSKLRILDPACGSGSFLIGAYQFLLDWHLREYLLDRDRWAQMKEPTIYQNGRGEWQLTIGERKRILLNNIYGVDIDQQAVEVTKLSLLLKVMEGENEQTLGTQTPLLHLERVLPNLSANIQCGNSLIGPDFYDGQMSLGILDEEEMYRINVFDWTAAFPTIIPWGGFDAVIGNPPWGAEIREEREYLVAKFPNVPKKTKDTYMYFVYQAFDILGQRGFLGFLIPNTWLLINNAKAFRNELMTLKIHEIIDHGDGVFKKATVESCTLILQNQEDFTGQCHVQRFRKGEKIIDHTVPKNIWLDDQYSRIIIDKTEEIHQLLIKLIRNHPSFETTCQIIWGIKPYQVGHGKPPQTKDMLKARIYHSKIKHDEKWKPLLVGRNVDRYQIHFPEDQYIKYGKWLMYPSNEHLMLQPKILLRQTSATLRACYDDQNFYPQNSIFIVHSEKIDLHYLLALLNSQLLGFIYKFGNPQLGKVFAEIKPSVIKGLPIHENPPLELHKQLITLAKQIMELHKRLAAAQTAHERTLLQRQITATDHQIDQLVYHLYSLTPQEIAIVEGKDPKGFENP